MKGTLASETFQNDAASAAASYTANGLSSASAAASTVSIAYDASRNAYILSTAGRSETFTSADLNAARTNATTTVYLKENGQTANSLTIVRPSVPAEFSFIGPGSVQPEYVAGAVWQRTTKSGSQISGSLDSAAYGVVAPDNAVPRNGSGRYEVGLAGVSAQPTDLASLAGTGALTVNFVSGSIIGGGSGNLFDSITGQLSGAFNWNATVQVASDRNALAGTISLNGVAGTLNGRFFGPQSQEVGAAFAVPGGSGANAATTSGVMIGKRRDSEYLNSSIAGLMFDQRFTGQNWGYVYNVDTATGALVLDRLISPTATGPSLRYYADSKAFSIDGPPSSIRTFLSSDLVTAQSGGNFDVYRQQDTTGSQQLSLYKIGQSNKELVLTYTGFANYRVLDNQFASTGRNMINNTWMLIGTPTRVGMLPTTGSAAYLGKMYGEVYVSKDTPQIAALTGDARFDFDFARASFTGSLRPIGTAGPTIYDLGTIPIGGTVNAGNGGNPPAFDMTQTSTNTFSLGGTFNGPTGEEFGGRFYGNIAIPGQSSYGTWTGVIVGKRQ